MVRNTIITVLLCVAISPFCLAQPPHSDDQALLDQKKILALSAATWQWMAEKDTPKLEILFHDNAKFVHMSGTWKKDRELEIIESGSIWYKDATVHDVAIEVFGNTAVAWNRITLEAVVRGREVTNEFTVTEVYQKEGGDWKMLVLTFSSVRDSHEIEH